ncbi:MAG: ModE family transcriptional regulator, partial [Comamonadaceae bacterium]
HAGPALARLAVRTSMRNQWPCVVQRLEVLGQIVRVHLAFEAEVLADGPTSPTVLASRITRESAELLGLEPGLVVQALCKATAVRVERRAAGPRIAASSHRPEGAAAGSFRLSAKAVRVVRGDSGDEVSAELAVGVQMVGFAAPGSGLRAGSRVELLVDDNAVVLALAEV